MGGLEVNEGKKKKNPTSILAANPIIGMNLSSSQTELMQSWGLGHSGPLPPHIAIVILSTPL